MLFHQFTIFWVVLHPKILEGLEGNINNGRIDRVIFKESSEFFKVFGALDGDFFDVVSIDMILIVLNEWVLYDCFELLSIFMFEGADVFFDKLSSSGGIWVFLKLLGLCEAKEEMVYLECLIWG